MKSSTQKNQTENLFQMFKFPNAARQPGGNHLKLYSKLVTIQEEIARILKILRIKKMMKKLSRDGDLQLMKSALTDDDWQLQNLEQ